MRAQQFGSNNPGKKIKGKKEKSSWIFGAGWNIVQDYKEKVFDNIKSWSLPIYPSQLSTEILGRRFLSYGAIVSYNRSKTSKFINGRELRGAYNFFSADAFIKYRLKEKIKLPLRIDPYFPVGFGYTFRSTAPIINEFTFNVGLGINIWLNKIVGINFQVISKLGINWPLFKPGADYLHHSFGLVFILDRTSKRRYSFRQPRYNWIHEKRKGQERE